MTLKTLQADARKSFIKDFVEVVQNDPRYIEPEARNNTEKGQEIILKWVDLILAQSLKEFSEAVMVDEKELAMVKNWKDSTKDFGLPWFHEGFNHCRAVIAEKMKEFLET